jgi:hypothetical protein
MSNSIRIPHAKTYHDGRSSQSYTNNYLIPHNEHNSYTLASQFMFLRSRSKLILKTTWNTEIGCKTKPNNLMIQNVAHVRAINIITTVFKRLFKFEKKNCSLCSSILNLSCYYRNLINEISKIFVIIKILTFFKVAACFDVVNSVIRPTLVSLRKPDDDFSNSKHVATLTNIKVIVVPNVSLFHLPAYGLWTNETHRQILEIQMYK